MHYAHTMAKDPIMDSILEPSSAGHNQSSFIGSLHSADSESSSVIQYWVEAYKRVGRAEDSLKTPNFGAFANFIVSEFNQRERQSFHQ